MRYLTNQTKGALQMVEHVYFNLLVMLSKDIVDPFLVPKLLPVMQVGMRAMSLLTNNENFGLPLIASDCL